MTYIKASQIKDVLMKTELVEGKKRLEPYYNSFGCLEGLPVIEKIDENQFRLITYYENYNFYNNFHPNVPFECQLKEFNSDTGRSLELLKQRFHGKARSLKKEKYILINQLNLTLSVNEIAKKTFISPAEIQKYIYEEDDYKQYREYAMDVNKSSTVESVVKYLKRYNIFKQQTEAYLLNMSVGLFTDRSLTKKNWDMIRFVIGNISFKFSLISFDNQILLLDEIRHDSMKFLTSYFSDFCDELLRGFPPGDDVDERPAVQ